MKKEREREREMWCAVVAVKHSTYRELLNGWK
jgi:hypothetical protein